MKALCLIALLVTCHNAHDNDCNAVKDGSDFSDQNLQLNSYADKCYNLKTICGDTDVGCLQYVFSFEEGDHHMRNEEWTWEYVPPDLYSIEGYEFNVFPSVENDGCWSLEALLFELITEACPCPFTPMGQIK